MEHMMHPADQICQVMARIYENKMTTVSGGNLSVRDADGTIWVSPSGDDKAALSRKNVCQVLPDGEVRGDKKPSLEYLIHLGILRVRPDIKAVLHAHPPALVTMSLIRRTPNVRMLPEILDLCGEVGISAYALPGSQALVENVSNVFAQGYNAVILENHGVFVGSPKGLFDAFKMFETLDFLARIELQAKLLNGKEPKTLTDEQIKNYGALKSRRYDEFDPTAYSSTELLVREAVCKWTKRAYDKQLFNSTQGVFSARIDEKSFVITPEGGDNARVHPEDLVKVSEGKRERGKLPHHTAFLHELIYRKDPDIRSIVISDSPYAATYVVTGEEYDVRLIPECFNRLRMTRNFPFDTLIRSPEEIAEYISLASPVAIVDNAFYLIASTGPFEAYDRMEIFEYTARSIHYSKSMGCDVINITEEQAKALRERFKLPKPSPVSL